MPFEGGSSQTLELSGALLADREQALRRWLRDYVDYVARVLKTAGTPAHELEDAVQRTFIVAARRYADVRSGAERGFLLRTALHVAAHARRSAARRREVPTAELPEGCDAVTPEELLSARRERGRLQQVLARLVPELRTVLLLYEVEELTMAEIAATLGIPPGTVASRLRRARTELRQRWRDARGATTALGVAGLMVLRSARAAAAGTARALLSQLGLPQLLGASAALGLAVVVAVNRPTAASSLPTRPMLASGAPSASVRPAPAPLPESVPAPLPTAPLPTSRANPSVAAASRGVSASPSPARPKAATEALRLELAQLDRARALLAAGRTEAALATLDAYERSARRGKLRLEAEVLRIDALARAGRAAQARSLAAAFLKRHPQSVLAARVRALAEK